MITSNSHCAMGGKIRATPSIKSPSCLMLNWINYLSRHIKRVAPLPLLTLLFLAFFPNTDVFASGSITPLAGFFIYGGLAIDESVRSRHSCEGGNPEI